MEENELRDELPCYADMMDMLNVLANRVPGSQAHVIDNIKSTLKQAAILVTCKRDYEEEAAIEELNNILR